MFQSERWSSNWFHLCLKYLLIVRMHYLVPWSAGACVRSGAHQSPSYITGLILLIAHCAALQYRELGLTHTPRFPVIICLRKCMSYRVPNSCQDIHLSGQDIVCLKSAYVLRVRMSWPNFPVSTDAMDRANASTDTMTPGYTLYQQTQWIRQEYQQTQLTMLMYEQTQWTSGTLILWLLFELMNVHTNQSIIWSCECVKDHVACNSALLD